MKVQRSRLAILGVLFALMTIPTLSWALTDEEIFRDFRFNFLNPSARAMGLGGAYVAEADDATAAQANPAALHYLNRMEFFIEYRETRPKAKFFAPVGEIGSLAPNSPGFFFGQPQSLWNPKDTSDISFVSFALPFYIGRHRVAVALSRQVQLDVKSEPDASHPSSTFKFGDPGWPGAWVNNRDYTEPVVERYTVKDTTVGSLDLQLVNYNLGLSYSITDFSFGVAATYSNMDLKTDVRTQVLDPLLVAINVNPRDPNAPSSDTAWSTQITSTNGSKSAFTYSVGLHWHPDSVFYPNGDGESPVRFGMVYRRGAKLTVDETVLTRINSNPGDDLANFQARVIPNTLRVPDRFAIGASYHTPRHWILVADVERIKYKDLLEDFQPRINFVTSLADPSAQFTYTVDDATVFHGGVEYRIYAGRWLHNFRAGYYNAPDNRIRFDHATNLPEDFQAFYRAAFPGGKSESHTTAGYGLSIPGGGLVLQIAGDFADSAKEYVGSLVYRFGKVRYPKK